MKRLYERIDLRTDDTAQTVALMLQAQYEERIDHLDPLTVLELREEQDTQPTTTTTMKENTMSTTHTVRGTTALSSLAELGTLTAETQTPEVTKIPQATFDISTLGKGTLPPNVRKNYLRALVQSLNWSIVGYVKRSIVAPIAEGSGIEGYNDAMSALEQWQEEGEHREENGFEVEMPPLEIATHLATIRAFLVDEVTAIENDMKLMTSTVPMTQRSLGFRDTLRSMLVPPAMPSPQRIREISEATGMAEDDVRLGFETRARRNVADTATAMNEIIERLSDLPTKAFGHEADDAFEALPYPARMRLMQKAIEGLNKQCAYAAADHMEGRRNNDPLGTYRMIAGLRNELLGTIHLYIEQHPKEQQRYEHILPVFERPAE